MIQKNYFITVCLFFALISVRSQCTMSVVPIAQFGGPGTYVNAPSGFLGPYQVCNNAVVYDTLGTSNRRYYLQSGTTLYLKNSFFHYVYMASNSTLVNLGGIGDVNVFKTINSTVSGMITPAATTCAAVSFPTLACSAPTVTGIETENNNTDFEIFPNPANKVLYIRTLNKEELIFTLRNTLGVLVLQGKIENEEQEMNISLLPEGIYFLELKRKDLISRKRILIIQ